MTGSGNQEQQPDLRIYGSIRGEQREEEEGQEWRQMTGAARRDCWLIGKGWQQQFMEAETDESIYVCPCLWKTTGEAASQSEIVFRISCCARKGDDPCLFWKVAPLCLWKGLTRSWAAAIWTNTVQKGTFLPNRYKWTLRSMLSPKAALSVFQ